MIESSPLSETVPPPLNALTSAPRNLRCLSSDLQSILTAALMWPPSYSYGRLMSKWMSLCVPASIACTSTSFLINFRPFATRESARPSRETIGIPFSFMSCFRSLYSGATSLYSSMVCILYLCTLYTAAVRVCAELRYSLTTEGGRELVTGPLGSTAWPTECTTAFLLLSS